MRVRFVLIALLLAPAALGAPFRGGSFAVLERPALAAHAEEWEAFLSIDGGKHYAFRVTPHLDAHLRRFTWLVPNVDARDARLLIRFGDEQHETIVELPQSFSIEYDRRAEIRLPRFGAQLPREAARAGDEPVVAQAEGDRQGTRVSETVDLESRRSFASSKLVHRHDVDAIASNSQIATPAISVAHVERARRIRIAAIDSPYEDDVLTLTTRLNI